MRLPPLVDNRIPLPAKLRITSPRTPLNPPVIVSPLTPAPALAPLRTMTGVPAKPGCVVPLIKTGSLTVGNAAAGVIVCGPAPGMLNVMLSTPAALFALRIACRSEPGPLSFVFVTTNDNPGGGGSSPCS